MPSKLEQYLVAFVAGASSLALEVIGPRYLAAIYGSTSYVWTAMITTTLAGLALGYAAGGRVRRSAVLVMLRTALVAAAILSALSGAVVNRVADALEHNSIGGIYLCSILGYFPAAFLFGLIAPLVIAWREQHVAGTSSSHAGGIYAVSTIGSLVGAVLATHYCIPQLGLALSTKAIAGTLAASCLLVGGAKLAIAGLGVVVLLPAYKLVLVSQCEELAALDSEYSSLRVLRQADHLAFCFGPSLECIYDIDDKRACAPYARRILDLLKSRGGTDVLVVGGAGDAIGLELQQAGTTVTVCELDPAVAELSRAYFGSSRENWIVADGRAALAELGTFDCIVLDAFSAPGVPAPHFMTLEGLQAFGSHLEPGGYLIANTHCVVAGPGAALFRGFQTTLRAAFLEVEVVPVDQDSEDSIYYQNVLFVAASPRGGHGPGGKDVFTDDRNAIERLGSALRAEFAAGMIVGSKSLDGFRLDAYCRSKSSG